jgi:hypothetical protein
MPTSASSLSLSSMHIRSAEMGVTEVLKTSQSLSCMNLKDSDCEGQRLSVVSGKAKKDSSSVVGVAGSYSTCTKSGSMLGFSDYSHASSSAPSISSNTDAVRQKSMLLRNIMAAAASTADKETGDGKTVVRKGFAGVKNNEETNKLKEDTVCAEKGARENISMLASPIDVGLPTRDGEFTQPGVSVPHKKKSLAEKEALMAQIRENSIVGMEGDSKTVGATACGSKENSQKTDSVIKNVLSGTENADTPPELNMSNMVEEASNKQAWESPLFCRK